MLQHISLPPRQHPSAHTAGFLTTSLKLQQGWGLRCPLRWDPSLLLGFPAAGAREGGGRQGILCCREPGADLQRSCYGAARVKRQAATVSPPQSTASFP